MLSSFSKFSCLQYPYYSYYPYSYYYYYPSYYVLGKRSTDNRMDHKQVSNKERTPTRNTSESCRLWVIKWREWHVELIRNRIENRIRWHWNGPDERAESSHVAVLFFILIELFVKLFGMFSFSHSNETF